MMLPGNAVRTFVVVFVVYGLKMVAEMPLKSPFRCAAVGTVPINVAPLVRRVP